MKLEAVLDRFEGDFALLLAGGGIGEGIKWPINLLPREAKEGDVLRVSLEVDPLATEKARQEASEILQQLLSEKKD